MYKRTNNLIKLCGILPFDSITTSDHRNLDIELALFLKDPLQRQTPKNKESKNVLPNTKHI